MQEYEDTSFGNQHRPSYQYAMQPSQVEFRLLLNHVLISDAGIDPLASKNRVVLGVRFRVGSLRARF
jgi:hypothetical protein